MISFVPNRHRNHDKCPRIGYISAGQLTALKENPGSGISHRTPPEPGSSPAGRERCRWHSLFMPSDCHTGVPRMITHPWHEENNKIRFRRPRSPLNGPWLCRRSGKPRRQATGAVWGPTPLGKKLGGPPLPAKCCGGTVRGSFPISKMLPGPSSRARCGHYQPQGGETLLTRKVSTRRG